MNLKKYYDKNISFGDISHNDIWRIVHEHGIIKKVKVLTSGRIRLASSTLYGAISALLENEVIVLFSKDIQRKGKKMYKITTLGKKLIYYVIIRLREMVYNGVEEVVDCYE